MGDDKVKPIRSGIKIEDPENDRKVYPAIVERLEFLLELAKKGELREFSYVGITCDEDVYSEFLGDVSYPRTMFAELVNLERIYYDLIFLGKWQEYE